MEYRISVFFGIYMLVPDNQVAVNCDAFCHYFPKDFMYVCA